VDLRRSAKVSDLDLDGLEVVIPRLGAHEEDFFTRPARVVGVVGIVLIRREESVAGRNAVEVVAVLEVEAHSALEVGRLHGSERKSKHSSERINDVPSCIQVRGEFVELCTS
jgi:hypothetical protein